MNDLIEIYCPFCPNKKARIVTKNLIGLKILYQCDECKRLWEKSG
jgi:uncharacterized Zn finger protein